MSVDTRFAATKRTAARTTGSASRGRLKLTVTWLTIAAALTFFTLTMAATAAGSRPDYAGALDRLSPGQPVPDNSAVVIRVGNRREVCSVGESQLALLQSRYTVGRIAVTVHGTHVDLVTVEGARPHELHELLGDTRCVLVEERHVFYLPFDPTSTE